MRCLPFACRFVEECFALGCLDVGTLLAWSKALLHALRELVSSLRVMNAAGLVHADLKADNLLLKLHGQGCQESVTTKAGLELCPLCCHPL